MNLLDINLYIKIFKKPNNRVYLTALAKKYIYEFKIQLKIIQSRHLAITLLLCTFCQPPWQATLEVVHRKYSFGNFIQYH